MPRQLARTRRGGLMEFVWDSLIALIVIGVTVGIFFGTKTSFIKLGFSQWKIIALIGFLIWVIQTWN